MEDNNNLNNASLISVRTIPEQYRVIFQDYEYFNVVQSAVFASVFYTDEPLVVAAPTGSGKTVVFELAIIRLLNMLKSEDVNYKIIYIAPMKAICEERLTDWQKKFAKFNIKCISITGDSDNSMVDIKSLMNYHIVISTPEKWDSLTRKWKENRELVQLIKLFMIDEVDLLNDQQRGPTLEAIVSRMKTIRDSFYVESATANPIRFLAVSSVIPNIEDIAEWLGGRTVAKSFRFDESARPVKLRKIVLGYPFNPQTSTPFKFDIGLTYKLHSIILQHSQGKPVLVFCNTRKSVEMTSRTLSQNLSVTFTDEQKRILQQEANGLADASLGRMLLIGVGYHHAGVRLEDRRAIEDLFRRGFLPVLVATSTLAMGVNLPAHLVIIKSTKYYTNNGFQDYDQGMLQQMMGRAGRPQFDSEGVAIILTTLADKAKLERAISESRLPLESMLHTHLTEHINAEIVLRTITDLGVAMQWITTTFLHIRARKNPKHYSFPSTLDPEQIDRKLLEICQIAINRLTKAKMITISSADVAIAPTPCGSLMAKFYIAFETMQLFDKISGYENLEQLLALLSKCKEFSEIYLRVNDKKYLNLLNKCRKKETIRFPFDGNIKTVDMKINCLIQAVFGCLDIADCSLITESKKIIGIGERISKCLVEYLAMKNTCFAALVTAITLQQCFATELWENSPFITKQLKGIGNVFSASLANAGLVSFRDILKANPRTIEMVMNKKPGLGNSLQEQVAALPLYKLQFTSTAALGTCSNCTLVIRLENAEALRICSPTISLQSRMVLLVGNGSNEVMCLERYSHNQMVQNVEITKYFQSDCIETLEAYLISEDWAGIDVRASVQEPSNSHENRMRSVLETDTELPLSARQYTNAKRSQNPSAVQTLIHNYFLNKPKQQHTALVSTAVKRNDEELKKMEECANKALSDYYKKQKSWKRDGDGNRKGPIISNQSIVANNAVTLLEASTAVLPGIDVEKSGGGGGGGGGGGEWRVVETLEPNTKKSLTWRSPLVTISNTCPPMSNTRKYPDTQLLSTPSQFQQFQYLSQEKFQHKTYPKRPNQTPSNNIQLQNKSDYVSGKSWNKHASQIRQPNKKIRTGFPLSDQQYTQFITQSSNTVEKKATPALPQKDDSVISNELLSQLGLLNPTTQRPSSPPSKTQTGNNTSILSQTTSSYYSQLARNHLNQKRPQQYHNVQETDRLTRDDQTQADLFKWMPSSEYNSNWSLDLSHTSIESTSVNNYGERLERSADRSAIGTGSQHCTTCTCFTPSSPILPLLEYTKTDTDYYLQFSQSDCEDDVHENSDRDFQITFNY